MPAREVKDLISTNRAPVLTLWAAVVAERLGFDWDEAVTLGRAVAGLNAQAKGRRLGIFKPVSPADVKKQKSRARPGESIEVELLGRVVPTLRTPDGLRADAGGKPASPTSVHRYLETKFGESLDDVREAMEALAWSMPPDTLAERAHELYEVFRPAVPAGRRGWGARGALDIGTIRELAGAKLR